MNWAELIPFLFRCWAQFILFLLSLSWAGSYSGPQSNTAFNITRWIVLRLVQISCSNVLGPLDSIEMCV
jgi:hypothetical protein